jgi:hypothetical protein
MAGISDKGIGTSDLPDFARDGRVSFVAGSHDPDPFSCAAGADAPSYGGLLADVVIGACCRRTGNAVDDVCLVFLHQI